MARGERDVKPCYEHGIAESGFSTYKSLARLSCESTLGDSLVKYYSESKEQSMYRYFVVKAYDHKCYLANSQSPNRYTYDTRLALCFFSYENAQRACVKGDAVITERVE